MNIKVKILIGVIIAVVLGWTIIGVYNYIPIYQEQQKTYAEQQQLYKMMESDGYNNINDWQNDLNNAKSDLKSNIENSIIEFDAILLDEERESFNNILNSIDSCKTLSEIAALKEQCDNITNAIIEELAAAAALVVSSTSSTSYSYVDYPEGVLTRSGGVNYYNNRKETWYSSNVLYHYRTSEWTPDQYGVYRDSEGYVVVAASDLPQGATVDTSYGMGKVYDSGCAAGTTDIYVNW